MVRHILLLNYADGFTNEENLKHAAQVKILLEELQQLIDEVLEMHVVIAPLPSSNTDIMITSLFDSPESLERYQNHPEHCRAAEYIGTVMKDRRCFDCFE